MKNLLSLILSITMLTSVAQLSAFADITAPVGTTEDNPVSAEASVQDETEDVAEVTKDEPVLYSTLERESAKLISLTAEETGFKLTDNSDVQANTTAEQSETEPVTSQATETDNTTNQPAGVTKVNGNMLKAITRGNSVCNADSIRTNTSEALNSDYRQTASYQGTTITGTGNYTYNSKNFQNHLDLTRMGVMPGIGASITTDADDVLVQCDNMIPQGMCSAGKYLLVSAYCKDATHHSVIYVLDNSTKSPTYLTTIVLTTSSHVGGIAYDGKRVWVAEGMSPGVKKADNYVCDRAGQNKISCFDFNALELENAEDYTNSYYAPGFIKDKMDLPDATVVPDCLTYDSANKLLYVGEFTYNNERKSASSTEYDADTTRIARYTVNSDSTLTYKDTLTPGTSAYPCNRVQGMAIVGSKLILSHSWDRTSYAGGNGASLIDIYDIPTRTLYGTAPNTKSVASEASMTNNNGKVPNKAIEMPPMVEGIVYDPEINRLYVMFESGSNYYINPNDSTASCQAPTDRILAMDIGDNFADDILNIGLSGNNNTTTKNLTDSGYEEVILKRTHKFTTEGNGTVHNGLNPSNFGAYIYKSTVPANKVWIVNIRGNFDLTKQKKGNSTYVTDGFLVESGGTLIIQTDRTDWAPTIRRFPYIGDSTWEPYLGDFIEVEKGGNLIISSSPDQFTNPDYKYLRFQGGADNGNNTKNGYTAATGSVIRTSNSGSGTSNWNINGFGMYFVEGGTNNEIAGLHPYDSFNDFVLKNCNFKHIVVDIDANDENRDGSAIFFSTSYSAKNTIIENLIFNNDLTPNYSDTTSLYTTPKTQFDAIRFQGSSTNFSMTGCKFSNSFARCGAVGFVNFNKDGKDNASDKTIDTLNIKETEFENCVGTATSNVTQNYNGTTQLSAPIDHYFGPLTFGSKVNTKLSVNNVTFSNCSAYSSGGIAFDRDAIIDEGVLGSLNTSATDNRKSLCFYNCTGKKNAGAIGIYGKINQLIVGDATINGCKSTNGSAIMIYGSATTNTKAEIADMKLQYTDIRNCVSKDEYGVGGNNYSGTVRSTGSAACKLTVDHCNITDNYVWKDGGGIYWNAMGTTTDVPKSSLYITDSVISNNKAAESGGGIYCEANISNPDDSEKSGIENTEISGNTAGNDGGGICQTIYDNVKESVSLTNTTLRLGSKVNIKGNTATDGGGVAFVLRDSANIADVTAAEKYSLIFSIEDNGENSASVVNNIANGYGGGVYYGTGSEIEPNDGEPALGADKIKKYTKEIILENGSISDNEAHKSGGGIYSNSGKILFSNGKIKSNKAGSVDITTTDENGNLKTIEGAGGGGGVFVINGGKVIVTGGVLSNNHAYGTNSNQTAKVTDNDYSGIGGGICVADGVAVDSSTETSTETSTDPADNPNLSFFRLTGNSIGIYSNTANFAADDVYASGNNTQLDVPAVKSMDLTGYNGTASGWFEDYCNNDTSYGDGTHLAVENKGSRYRYDKGIYPRKYMIPGGRVDDSTSAVAYAATTENEDMINAEGSYICMTLGTLANINISNNIFTKDGSSLNGTDKTEFTYTMTSTDTLTDTLVTYEKGGVYITPKINNNSFTFTLMGGETISFPNLTSNLSLTVTQNTTKTQVNNLDRTTYSFNSVDVTDDEYDYSFTTNPTQKQSLVYNNYIDRYVTVTLNYYNRKVENGKPAAMESDATTIQVPVQLDNNNVKDGKIDTGKIIIDAAVYADSKNKFDNVIEGYCVWLSQKEAKAGIASYYNFHSSGNYTQSDYHTDCYGNPQTSGKWITYNNDALTENETTGALDDTSDLSTINVWLFNYPKTYKVTYYSATDGYSTNAAGDTYVHTNNESVLSNIYYNQRLGSEDDAEEGSGIDTLTGHLTGYGISSVSNSKVTTASEITVSGTPYYFKGWATDEAGKVIVSTDIRYRYRVTNDITLYPVYSKSKANVGLTATAINPDVFVDSDNIAKTRLNTMLNPYGCPDKDTNIKKVAIVYVTDKDGNIETNKAKVQAAVQKSLADNDSKSEDRGVSFADKPLKIDGGTVNGTETTQQVTIGNANYFVHLVSSDDVTLTSKNRVQFTTTFRTDQLNGKTLAAFVAMKYNNEWKVSDNYINYIFDANGTMTSSESVAI